MSHNSAIKNGGGGVHRVMYPWDTPRVNIHSDPDLGNPDGANDKGVLHFTPASTT